MRTCPSRSAARGSTVRLEASSLSLANIDVNCGLVPSNVERMLAKSLQTPADRFIFDLEDSVADAQKDEARSMLSTFLNVRLAPLPLPERVAVRVNAVGTPYFEQDIRAALELSSVRTIVLPKVLGAHDLSALERVVGARKAPLNVVASIESAAALMGLRDIAGWKAQLSGSRVRVAALLFAAEDYCADTRVQRTPSGEELVFPRTSIAIAARAYGLQSIDMVHVDYKNTEGLIQECQSARRLGFDGKQAIHPDQVPIIQEQFLPTPQEIDRAAKIVQGMDRAKLQARGSYALKTGNRTEMIDAPMVKQAQITLAFARAAGLYTD
ncbi:beta subunit of citrate lyase [Auricularia subglabra TFB-10046 SS5]|uniref:Beta subunit of citrate lyase n=1 Tax=Auricularia subglabra (strain TFB-10046 / SS5) TaxID=717982 RepID=J0D2E2_AURST|nr:beta subunit of citrate lyase [Auricularia subglabra TFB-10046 SS5]